MLVHSKPVFENPEESDLFEGDIMGMVKDERGAYQIPTLTRTLWPNGFIPYVFDNKASFSASELNNFYAGIKNVEDSTRVNGKNSITFKEYEKGASDLPDIYILINRSNGCSSYIGRQITKGAQTLSLASGCLNNIGTTAHEFMHAMGWFHEQSRPDRDDHVTIMYENITPGYESNFNKYSTSVVGLLHYPYDYGSVMHYSSTSFSKNGQPTIVVKTPGSTIGQRNGYSAIDAAEVIEIYGPKGIARSQETVYLA